MRLIASLALALALIPTTAKADITGTWHGTRPARETALLKWLPLRSELHAEIRANRRERKREAAAKAARATEQAAAAAQATPEPTYASPVVSYSGGWADGLRAAGFPEWAIPQMLYYIDRESGGNPSAINPSSGACGLLQLYPCPGSYALDPATNLRLAYAKFKAGGFSPWGG